MTLEKLYALQTQIARAPQHARNIGDVLNTLILFLIDDEIERQRTESLAKLDDD